MSKIIRLNPTDARTWRQNQPVLLDSNGAFVRLVSFSESRALGDVEKRARHLRQPVKLAFKDESGKSVELSSTPMQLSRETIVLRTTIDGLEVMSGRDYFRKQVLEQHGECQLRSHTGQFMCSIRDPNVVRPSAKDAMRNAPKPSSCPCRDWGTPHEGRHHPICEWNVKAPPDERALPEDSMQSLGMIPVAAPVMKQEKPSILNMPRLPERAVRAAAASAVSAPVAKAQVMKPVAPEDCVCKDWAKTAASEPGKHHPICEHKEAWEAWEANHGVAEKFLLVNLETSEIGRQATAEEARAARSEAGFVLIGDVQFGVITESEARAKGAA
jgi:hypothetical protein